jgi:serine/threonine protein kinase
VPGRFGTGDLLPLTDLANRYVILERIAQGGMGAIYRAQDQRLQGKIVAVKEMSESAIAPAEREHILECFQREAELLARLDHPNLVRVSDLFQEGERRYMVMEFIEGKTLEKMLEGRTAPFPEEQVLIWADQLCEVLSYLHGQRPKIIYRDMKPTNVMVLEGTDTVKLIDFGIARFFKPGKRRDTVELGTDGYAPPEQYGKFQTDERADIYALGAMLHQLLTLRDPVTVPFQFPPVRKLNPKASRRIETVIAKAVKPVRDSRHQSVEEMQIALLGDGTSRRDRIEQGDSLSVEEGGKRAKPTRPAAVPPLMLRKLKFTPSSVDFGEVLVGSQAPDQSLKIDLPPGEKATFSTDVAWLCVEPCSLSKSGSKVTVKLDSGNLRLGRVQLQGGRLHRWAGWHTRLLVPMEQKSCADVKIQLKCGHSQRIPVSVTAAPQPGQVYLGWIGTGLAMLIEAGTALTILLGALAAIAGILS